MTKEDFDAEVYEYAKSRNGTEDSRMTDRMLAYRAGAKSKEKQIQIDAEQIRALQKQNGELTDELTKKSDTNHQLVEQLAKLNERCSELEAQIEKMKRCAICKYSTDLGYCKIRCSGGECDNYSSWEIKEND